MPELLGIPLPNGTSLDASSRGTCSGQPHDRRRGSCRAWGLACQRAAPACPAYRAAGDPSPETEAGPRAEWSAAAADRVELLHAPRFADQAPAEIYATLLDEGIYHCSIRTMYRLLGQNGEIRERREQLRHPVYLEAWNCWPNGRMRSVPTHWADGTNQMELLLSLRLFSTSSVAAWSVGQADAESATSSSHCSTTPPKHNVPPGQLIRMPIAADR